MLHILETRIVSSGQVSDPSPFPIAGTSGKYYFHHIIITVFKNQKVFSVPRLN